MSGNLIYSVIIEVCDQTEKILVRPVFNTLYDAESYINASFNVGVFLVSGDSLIGGQPLLEDVSLIGIPTSNVKKVTVTFADGLVAR